MTYISLYRHEETVNHCYNVPFLKLKEAETGWAVIWWGKQDKHGPLRSLCDGLSGKCPNDAMIH
jgi:hypothetical protein